MKITIDKATAIELLNMKGEQRIVPEDIGYEYRDIAIAHDEGYITGIEHVLSALGIDVDDLQNVINKK